jgi:hypothetical protein
MIYREKAPAFPDLKFLKRLKRDVFSPYKISLLMSAGLLLIYILFSVLLNVSFFFSFAVFVLFGAAFGFSMLTWTRRGDGRNHIRFVPVLMIRPALNPLLLTVMLPFFIAAAAAGVSVPALPQTVDSNLFSLQEEPVTEDEYLAHAAHQLSFSYRPLGRADDYYPVYIQTPDNMIEPAPYEFSESRDVPLFPLKNLMEFLAVHRGDKNLKR